MKTFYAILVLGTFCTQGVFAGSNKPNSTSEIDSSKGYLSGKIEILEIVNQSLQKRLREEKISDPVLIKGKKVEIITLNRNQANLALNVQRQVFSTIPGVQIWEQDAYQVGVATRGFSPNRSWETNVRMNGYDVSSDPYGYPEAYFTPTFEAVERIEFIRGAAALAYGCQPVGMMNYVIKKNNIKPIYAEFSQTAGSNGFISTYNQFGVNKKRLHFNSYLQYRRSDGYRKNSKFENLQYHASLYYDISKNWETGIEITGSQYNAQQPGGLTDADFRNDIRQSFRSRNWMSLPWFIAAAKLNYKNDSVQTFTTQIFFMDGQRNSVGNTAPATAKDATIDGINFSKRRLDRDLYRNIGMESRYSRKFATGKIKHTLNAGIRAFAGTTKRWQNGIGTNGNNLDLSLTGNSYARTLDFTSFNAAIYAEYQIQLSEKFAFNAGVRNEHITTGIGGKWGVSSSGEDIILQSKSYSENFIVPGAGFEFKQSAKLKIYGNATSFYRPVLFSDLTPAATSDSINPNLASAKGFNYDLGVKGMINEYLNYDVSLFYVDYRNRVGGITIQNAAGQNILYRTNLGNSFAQGIELFLESDIVKIISSNRDFSFMPFLSMTFMEARYKDFSFTQGGEMKNYRGNRLENAPSFICRTGFSFNYGRINAGFNFSYVEQTFSDALNTANPSANAQTGMIPSYRLYDVTAGFNIYKNWSVNAGINNLTDEKYFTRRAGGYPGPGIIPAEGRTFFVSSRVVF